jgi:4-hydroxy-2-oxoheptanedioate aldolase
VGGWCVTGSALTAEAFAVEGYDYVGIDCQHGLIGYDSMVRLLTALGRTGTTPLVRVPANDAAWIGQALDAGAEGVIVPMVNSGPEAERAVAACRYAPGGTRSFGPIRASMFVDRAGPDLLKQKMLCFAMVETADAVEHVEEICATEGLDGVYLGPYDLALSMGESSTSSDEWSSNHARALELVFDCCRKNGIVAGIHALTSREAERYMAQGFQVVTIASDLGLFRMAARQQLAVARDLGRISVDEEMPMERRH